MGCRLSRGAVACPGAGAWFVGAGSWFVGAGAWSTKGNLVGLILLVLLLALLLGGLGFAAHLLWIIAAIVFVFWLIGFALARGETAGGGRRRWYRW